MPSLDDITRLADSLEREVLIAIPERCVRVRNRNADCSLCLDVCQVGALEIEDNEISFSPSLCVNCGACASVCPTEALIMLEPTRQAVLQRCLEVQPLPAGDTSESVVITCARMAARKNVATNDCVEVPCLAYVDEALLLATVAKHRCDILLLDADCATCKYGWTQVHVDDVVAQANDLLETVAAGQHVDRLNEAPACLQQSSEKAAIDFREDRRNFFSTAAHEMKQTALRAAQQTIEAKLGGSQESIYNRLRVGGNNVLPQFAMERHMQLLDALDSFEPDPQIEFDSALFAHIGVQSDLCNSCGMCATFCPTGAISVASFVTDSHTPKQLGFLACDCVDCGVCADICWKHALSIEQGISAKQLFSFEPTLIDLGTRKPKIM